MEGGGSLGALAREPFGGGGGDLLGAAPMGDGEAAASGGRQRDKAFHMQGLALFQGSQRIGGFIEHFEVSFSTLLLRLVQSISYAIKGRPVRCSSARLSIRVHCGAGRTTLIGLSGLGSN